MTGGAAHDLQDAATAIEERVKAVITTESSLRVASLVSTADCKPDATADGIYDRIMDNVEDGSIVELHRDAQNSGALAAGTRPWVTTNLRAQRDRFRTIADLIQPCS